MKKPDAAAIRALEEAVAALERCSCAEVVVEVRAHSGSYAHADARFASLIAFVALLLLLFSPWHFQAGWVAVDVALVWAIGVLAGRRSDSVRRLMTSERERATQTRTVAAAVFHDRGVANTGGETGVLVYLSLLEEKLELLADRGVLQGVPALEWNRIAAQARGSRASTATLLELLREVTPLLEKHLPVRAGDVDELCNTPRFVSE